jgi:hypothetical protein
VRPPQDNCRNMLNKLEKVQTSLSELLNNQTKLNLSKGNRRALKMRRLSMQEVHTWMQECLISRMALSIRWVTSTTLGWTLKVKNSSSSPWSMSNKRRNKAPRLLSMFPILMLMLLMFLIYHIIILMPLIYLWEIRLVKLLLCILGHTTRGLWLVCECPKCLYLTWKNPNKFG